ncbi:MAG: D-Ala-D-Ala carboxypeptidase family metallohydrolase [Bacillota bacterium]|nr:D-Ala-D-Ala carboxypeptidase family metallohydrolase [Bacillota bacterium]
MHLFKQTGGDLFLNQISISENFILKEFECNDGSHQVALRHELLDKLQRLREEAGKPVIITSGYRNPSHNARVGGSPTSRHLTGEAADIRIPGLHPDEVAQLAAAVGFTGIGIYDSFTHVDIRPVPARWRG